MDSAERTTLGVDYGTVRIGLALALPGGGLIVPLETLPHPGDEAGAAAAVAAVARSKSADEVVIGDPLHMDGSESPMALRARRFGELLAEASGLEVHHQDERLTSQAAERQLREAGYDLRSVDKGHIDAIAAMGILRDFLQRHGRLSESSAAPPPEPDLPEPEPRRGRRARRRDLRRRR